MPNARKYRVNGGGNVAHICIDMEKNMPNHNSCASAIQ